MQRKYEVDLLNGSIFKSLIIFSLPLIGVNVLQLLFNSTDVALLGILVSDEAVAAVGSTGALINLIIGLFVGLSVGANVYIARCVGNGNIDSARRAVGSSCLLSLICGSFVAIIGFFFSRTFLIWIDCDEAALDMATIYLQIYFLGAPVSLLYNFCTAILRATGDTFRPLIYLIISGVLNVLLNTFSILVLKKTVEGVAFATIFSQLISSILCIITLVRNTGYSKLILKNIKINKEEVLEICKIGLPAGLQGCVFSISNVLIQNYINNFGLQTMTANSIASQFDSYIYTAMNAVAVASVSITSQNLGANNLKRIKQNIFTTLTVVITIGIVLGALVILLSTPLCRIITKTEKIIEIAKIRLLILSSTYFFCGIMDTVSNQIRALGKSITAMIICLSGSCIFRIIYLFYFFPFFPYLSTIYYAYTISWILTATIGIIVLYIQYLALKKTNIKA